MNKPTLRHMFLSLLARIPVAASQAGAPPRIVLIRPDHLGDLLFMTPALHALRKAAPDAHIACLVGPWGEAILRDSPDLDQLLTCDFPWFNRRPRGSLWQPYAALWREAQRLRAQRFDVAYVMRFDFWWGAALARLAGIPRRIGYALPDVRPFLTEAMSYTPGLHEVEQNLRLVGDPHPQPLSQSWERGGSPQSPRLSQDRERGGSPQHALRFTVTAADAAWAAARLPAAASQIPVPGSRPFIALHPGAGALVKLWSVDGWVRVASELARQHGATIVLTGGAAERDLAQSIASRLSAPHTLLAGETSLSQLAAVFARCRLVLGADSGPLHLAVAVGAPTLHLFGPVDPALFGPWGDARRHIVVQARYFDQPCRNRPCNRLDYAADELWQHPCMQTITVADVLAAANQALGADN